MSSNGGDIRNRNDPLSGEVENVNSLLIDDDVSEVDKTPTRRLQRASVDADRLLSDFVSSEAIRSYFTECRDTEYERESETKSPSSRKASSESAEER